MIFFIAATVARITEIKGKCTFWEKRREISRKTELLKFEFKSGVRLNQNFGV